MISSSPFAGHDTVHLTTGILLVGRGVISEGAILTNCSADGQSRVHGKPISLLPIGVLVFSKYFRFFLFSSIFPPLKTQW